MTDMRDPGDAEEKLLALPAYPWRVAGTFTWMPEVPLAALKHQDGIRPVVGPLVPSAPADRLHFPFIYLILCELVASVAPQ